MLEQEQFNFQNWSVNSVNNSERSLSITSSRVSTWVPDYNLKAITDLMYLKIRRGIYQLAIKANKLKVSNSESEANIKELDLVETLLNETKVMRTLNFNPPIINLRRNLEIVQGLKMSSRNLIP